MNWSGQKLTAEKRLNKARLNLVMDHSFFGCLAMRLKVVQDNTLPTAAVDGEHLFYNEQFILSLTEEELLGVYAHEILHCALGHVWREGDRDHNRWNRAIDYVTNEMLKEAGFTLPKGALFNSDYATMAAERVYTLLPKQGNSEDPGGCGGIRKSAKEKEEDGQAGTPKNLHGEWKAAIANALRSAEHGTLPAGLKKLMNEIVHPAIPWEVVLFDFVDRHAQNDYSWRQPNRNYFSNGLVLPTLISQDLPFNVVAIDTSMSTHDAVKQFCSEVSGVLAAYSTTTLVIFADAEIQGEPKEYTSTDLPIEALEPQGFGGTSFKPVFRFIEERGLDPSCLIYLTDLEGDFPEEEPPYPVLWVTIKDHPVPFGEKVLMKGFRE